MNNNSNILFEIKCRRLSTLSTTPIMPFGGIGVAFINWVRARLLKILIKLIASEFGTFANDNYSRLKIDDFEAIANIKFVD